MSRNINKYEEVYLKSDFENQMVSIRRKKVLEIINKLQPKRILEIGCGVDPIFKFYNDFELFVVVEPSPFFAETANIEKRKYLNRNIKVHQNFIEEKIEELKAEKFDLVLLSGLLHEVKDPQNLINEIKKLMIADTVLHVNVPNANSFHRVLAKEAGLISSEFELSENNIKLQQNTIFNLSSLINVFEKNNFEIQSKGSYFIKPFTHKQMKQLLDGGLMTKELLSGFYNMTKYMPDMGAEIFVNLKLV